VWGEREIVSERERERKYVHKETDIPFLVFWPQIGHLMRNRSNPFATGHEKNETSLFYCFFLLFYLTKNEFTFTDLKNRLLM